MSTAATETIIENHVNGSKTAVKAFSDKKNTSGKNGFIKEKTSKEYFFDIVKEAISKKISDDEETKEDSTNFVVGKVVEIEEQIVNSEIVTEACNSVEAEVFSDKNENTQRTCESELSPSEENDLQVPIKSEIEIVSSLEGEMGTTFSKLVNGESSERLPKEDGSNNSCNEDSTLSNIAQIDVSCCKDSSEPEINGIRKETNEILEKQDSISKIEEDISTNQTPQSMEISDENKDTSIVKPSESVNNISNENHGASIVPPVEESSEIVENHEKSNDNVVSSLNSEKDCVSIQENVKSCEDNESLNETSSKVELNSKNNDQLLIASEEGNPVEVQNGTVVDSTLNISENEKSMEWISSNDDNADKTVRRSLKRASTPDKNGEETSKKLKLSDTEENSNPESNKRLSTECNGNETKKLCSSNSKDLEQPITSKESTENSDVKGNKENNENFQTDEKNDENKQDKIVDTKKLSKEKLKKKELKKIKDKKEKDTISDVNDTSECASSNVKLTANETEETSENENIQPGIGKLKLKKKLKGPDEVDEYELDKTSPTSCPVCSCDCKLKKEDRKILGEKSRGLIDILSNGSDNININLVQTLEELVGQTVVDWATNKCDVGAIRKKAHFLEEEHDRLLQLTVNLKKQLDDARCIIKRMIDEKLAQKSWSEGIVPLKVTRSVGMQVCTTGSAHVLIKRQEEKDKGSSRLTSSRLSSSFNVTTPELQTNSRASDLPAEGIINDTTAICVSNSNPLKETPAEVARMDVVGSSRVASPGRGTPRLADGASSVMNVNIIDDDIEVIEPVVDAATPVQPLATSTATTAPVTTNNNSNQILISATLATFNSATNTTTTTTTTSKTIAPGIYILKTTDVPNAQNQLQIAAAPTQQATTPASEVIDLTDNDPVSFSSNTTNSNRMDRSSLRVATGPTATTNQNAVNFAVATTGVQNKVVTFPADSTTFLIHRSPNSTNSGLRKTTIQPPPSSDILLTTMSALPPLPRSPKYGVNILKPPRPILRICKNSTGIMLSWNFDEEIQTKIRKYQVFAYQEGTPIDSARTDMWKKVGDVDALPLPMACTLTQFKEGHRYYFVVRAMDSNSRLGEFSLPGSIMLTSSSTNTVNKTPGTRV